jgi:membrane peptidoglycan carboxypeptidase
MSDESKNKGVYNPHKHNTGEFLNASDLSPSMVGNIDSTEADISMDNGSIDEEDIVFPKTDDESDYSVLDEDGYIKANGVKVLNKHSKVSTDYNKTSISKETNAAIAENIGRKPSHKKGDSIKTLRKKVGFSWDRFGRKFILAGVIFGIIGIVGASIAAAYLIDIWNETKDVDLSSQPKEKSVVYARDGQTVLFEYYGEERRQIVQYEQIPENMRLAIIALEDKDYYYNDTGIPWRNIAGAALKCIQGSDDECRGGSGLSQQYIKNLTQDDERSVNRKIKELFTALRLNQEKNKEEILTLYLNQVPFGRNAYGIQEASQSYFKKNVEQLTTEESCFLASLPQKPSTFAAAATAKTGDDWNDLMYRKDFCLNNLRTLPLAGKDTEPFIKTDEELDALKAKPLELKENIREYQYPHFSDYVTKELQKFGIRESALYTRGYKIITTLDPAIQKQTEESIASNYENAVRAFNGNNASAVVLDGPTGQIMAMVGSADYNNTEIDGQVNIATSPQQPGSSIKPYVYLTDFLQGFNPGTVVIDSRMDFGGGFRPKNFTDKNNGPVSLRYSLQSSLNIPAVKGAYLAAGESDPALASDQAGVDNVGSNGIKTVIETAKKLGAEFPYEDKCFLSTAIGGCEMTMLSHATALNTVAQEGNRKTATPFLSIVDSKTKEDIYATYQGSQKQVYPVIDGVIDARYARQLNNVLSDHESRYPIFCGSAGFRCPLAARLDLVDQGWDKEFKVAAKTGTTDDVKDAWTVGYSPYYTTTVWVGNTDNTAMDRDADSSSTAGTIWKDIMVKLHVDKEKKGFSREGLEEVSLNPQTGLLGTGKVELLTSEQRQILEDTKNRLNSNNYNPRKNTIFQNRSVIISRTLNINKIDGKLAVDGKTLPQFVEQRTYVTYVPEFPVGEWKAIADAYNRSLPQPPTEFSNQDQINESNNKPRITTNVVANAQAPGNIVVQAQVTGGGEKQITSVSISIDGQEVANEAGSQALFNTAGVAKGKKTVTLKAVDSFGAEVIKTFEQVDFNGNQGNDSSGGVTIETPPSTSISAPTITLRVTSNDQFSTPPTLILTQGVVSRQCQATRSENRYQCQINTSGFIPTVDDDSKALIEFVDNSDSNITANPKSINLTL